ncbi:hypothetical protein GCM10027578_17520 [Spirosoma luteolum]
MKRQLSTLVALLGLATASLAQTADDIVNKHVAALGGADKIAAVKTAEYEQTMSVQGMEFKAKTVAIVGKSSRSDISVMGQTITQVIDGDKGWAINPMQGGTKAEDLPADMVKLQKSTTEPSGMQLAYAKQNKLPYALVGKEKLNGKDVYNISVTRPEGIYNYYLDATTYQLLSSKSRLTVQGQPVEGSAVFSNYKTVDGLTLPYTLAITGAGMPGTITATVTKLTLNGTINPSVFAKPN